MEDGVTVNHVLLGQLGSIPSGGTLIKIFNAACPGGEGAVLKTVGRKRLARSNRVCGAIK